ncbi:MAG: electron transport complex subunit RsxA [Firmicutes bacterium]|nr:electron transport complex subunit RsxA [Bacillota bacterium]
MELFLIFLGAAFVNNFVLVRFLGICPFIGVSTKFETSIGMGLATTFVMVVASTVTWLIQHFILAPFGIEYLQTVAFILTIASLVQLVEMFLHKASPALYRALGIYLPLITTNCAILGMAVLLAQGSYNLGESIIFAIGAGVGFSLALIILAAIREELEFADIPKPLRGAAIAFIIAGILALAFKGFEGLV